MAQFFNRTANTVARFTLWGFAAAVGLVTLGGFWIVRSPYENREDEPREQPVPFSHEHHAGDLGIDSAIATRRSKNRRSRIFRRLRFA